MLRVRWLGRVRFQDAHALQRGLFEQAVDDHLLLLEHPSVVTLGLRADPAHVLVPPGDLGAELVRTNRGGDVTWHGPGQLVGYPIVRVPGGPRSVPAHVHGVEQVVIDALADLGLRAGRLDGYPGVWVDHDGPDPRKICAIGVRVTRGRSMHGFALNVDPDLAVFDGIVPCGIADRAVTSLAAEGVAATMREVVDAVAARAAERWGAEGVERQDVVWRERPEDLSAFSRGAGPGRPVLPGPSAMEPVRVPEPVAAAGAVPVELGAVRGSRVAQAPAPADGGTPVRLRGRLAQAGVAGGLDLGARKPEWLRARAHMGPDYLQLKRTMRDLDLVTVCEEAGCPNIFECWSDGTATFMINGERCTRACGFCLVDTRHPEPPDPHEPARVAEAVDRMALQFAVVTAVARDDLPDGGAAGFGATIRAIRARRPGTQVEVLIPDCKGEPEALDAVFAARPDVLNHNLETVARLQRAVRPSASYARSLAVLARARAAGLVTKSSLIVGMGETEDELLGAMADLRDVGVGIVTVGQYLRPTSHHLPVARWWTPEEFAAVKAAGEAMGIPHVESSPLTRSSYHAKQAAGAASAALAGTAASRPA